MKISRYMILVYLIAISTIINAKSDWSFGDILMYGGMAIAGGAVAIVAAPVAIGAAGFTATGIASGSLAAALQAGVGNVACGSAFAALQSAGVAGLGGASSAVLATGGAAVGASIMRAVDKDED